MILDGGLGVELAQRGFTPTTSLWSGEAVLRAPELLLDVHGAYVAAGANMIATATYQMSHAALRELGYGDPEIDAVFARAVALAREAVARHSLLAGQDRAAVAASLGPFGATVGDGSEYRATQHLAPADLAAFHAERLRAVVRSAPDAILFETIPTRSEALVIAGVLRDLHVDSVWMSFTCADGEHTFGGDRIADIAVLLEAQPNVAALGINCTAPAAIAPLVRSLRAATSKPIFICPNLGQHWETDSHALAGGATAAAFLHDVPEWLTLGVAHVGGCCGVGPATIGELRAIVDGVSRPEGDVRAGSIELEPGMPSKTALTTNAIPSNSNRSSPRKTPRGS